MWKQKFGTTWPGSVEIVGDREMGLWVPRSPRDWRLLLLIALTIIGGILYASSMDNSFHYDDEGVILRNEDVHHLSHLPDLWTNALHADKNFAGRGHYRPLVLTSYLLDYSLGGTNPVGYHGVNLLIHILTAFLVALVLERLTGRLAVGALSGLLFLVHPFNSEAVNYITARSSQMYALFYLLSFYAYLRYRSFLTQHTGLAPADLLQRQTASRQYLWLGVSCISFVLSMLSKELAVTLPVTLLLYEWLIVPARRWRDRLYHLWLPVSFSLLVVVFHLVIRKVLVGAVVVPGIGRHLLSQLATHSVVLVRTLGLILWPANLTIDHRVEVYKTFLAWPVVWACLLLIGISGIIFWWSRSEDIAWRVRAFLLAWFFVVLFPLVVIPLSAMLQENRAYLAVAGIVGLWAIGLVWVLDWVRTRRPNLWWVTWIGIVAMVLAYGGLTVQRNMVWQDDVTLWSDAVQKEPYSNVSRDNLGVAYDRLGQIDLAAEQYRTSWILDPTNAIVVWNLAELREKQGRLKEARAWHQAAFRLNPGFYTSLLQRGSLEELENRWNDAIKSYRRAVFLRPDAIEGHLRLAKALVQVGDKEEAVKEYEMILQMSPGNQSLQADIRDRLKMLRDTSGQNRTIVLIDET